MNLTNNKTKEITRDKDAGLFFFLIGLACLILALTLGKLGAEPKQPKYPMYAIFKFFINKEGNFEVKKASQDMAENYCVTFAQSKNKIEKKNNPKSNTFYECYPTREIDFGGGL